MLLSTPPTALPPTWVHCLTKQRISLLLKLHRKVHHRQLASSSLLRHLPAVTQRHWKLSSGFPKRSFTNASSSQMTRRVQMTRNQSYQLSFIRTIGTTSP